jgi:hypothetical protein
MQDFRSMGRAGLDAYVKRYGSLASPDLDHVCAQKDAHTSLLYWHTDLDAALADARRARRPILSLRLLGRLDEELSCANSRFFRKLLYPDPEINTVLRERFVLHWQSVRPVPRVTIDFGNGRRLERTLTGNSVHVVLDPLGRPRDALPGLFAREVFVELLAGRRPSWPRQPVPRALAASRIAPTKHVVEAPLLRGVMFDADADTNENLVLQARAREALASNPRWTADAFVAWIYRELFLMPPEDPALGLDVPDPVAAYD